jgi:hypothetical protein
MSFSFEVSIASKVTQHTMRAEVIRNKIIQVSREP